MQAAGDKRHIHLYYTGQCAYCIIDLPGKMPIDALQARLYEAEHSLLIVFESCFTLGCGKNVNLECWGRVLSKGILQTWHSFCTDEYTVTVIIHLSVINRVINMSVCGREELSIPHTWMKNHWPLTSANTKERISFLQECGHWQGHIHQGKTLRPRICGQC